MSDARGEQTIVVGAGVAGLSCARALAAAGRKVLVVERARGVGGRCATRRIEGQPVDFGVLFFHGRDRAFLAALDGVAGRSGSSGGGGGIFAPAPQATAVPGWPRVIHGAGRPCQPDAFAHGARRLAFAEGASAFPESLADGLEVRTGAQVISFEVDAGAVRLEIDGSPPIAARTVVLALAGEQTLALLHASSLDAPALATARALLGMLRSHPCLTVVAIYPRRTAAPPWDICYPDGSRVLELLAHDSAKRPSPSFLAMVYQAHPRWSREHFADERWPDEMIAEAARILGRWAAGPRIVQPYRWRHARTDLGAELSSPLLCELPGGARLGIAGELFAPGGGVEAAWTSAGGLARRILAEENR
jgi:renalase